MTPKQPLRPARPDQDPDGKPVYIVPVTGTNFTARILADDWHDLQQRGYSPNWCFSGGAVHTRRLNATAKDMPERISRVLMGVTDSRTYVRFRDRNPLNLRRDNLYLYHVKSAEERDAELSAKRRQRLGGWATYSGVSGRKSRMRKAGY
ncbi:hypothetical protein ACERNI_06535 [Camelimonas sp. ID_303_24]